MYFIIIKSVLQKCNKIKIEYYHTEKLTGKKEEGKYTPQIPQKVN